jgi:hypothetical protein
MHLEKSFSPIAFLSSKTLNSFDMPINFSISLTFIDLSLDFTTINLSNSLAILLISVPNNSVIKKEDFLSIVKLKDFR